MDWSEINAYMARAVKIPILTREEEVLLAHAIRRGGPEAEEARQTFLTANLRLVIMVARQFSYSKLGLADLVQEGNLGMMRALEKFDPDKGFKFSTYAGWWIRQAMTRASEQQGDTVRLPGGQHNTRHKVKRTREHLTEELGRPPTEDEIANYIGIRLQDVQNVGTLPRIEVSLDDPVGEDGSLFGDLLEDEATVSGERVAIIGNLRVRSQDLFEGLPEREALIIRLRFMEDPPWSLEEIGQLIGLTRERIRQIILGTLKTLRLRALNLGL